MKINRKKATLTMLLVMTFIVLFSSNVYAAPTNVDIPNLNLTVGNGNETPADYVNSIKLLIFFTVIALMPSFVIMMTSFTRILVVFTFLKNAMGAAQMLPAQIMTGLALFLTLFIMEPVYTEINNDAIKPYLNGQITQEQAIETGAKPLKKFMLKQTREKDLELFIETSNVDKAQLTRENIPFTVLIPAFSISELKTAFEIGFLLYLPFIVMDMVVGCILMSMGMMMLPPAMVSLPFKILLFVMVDGWHLLIKSLVASFS